MDRPEAAVIAFRGARELRPDLRTYQGVCGIQLRICCSSGVHIILEHLSDWKLIVIAGLVRSYLACSKVKEALYTAREAMKAMPQSARALKLVGDVHASNPGGREKVYKLFPNCSRTFFSFNLVEGVSKYPGAVTGKKVL